MRIDRSHRPWLVFCTLLLAAAGAWYAIDLRHGAGRLHGASGGSLSGLSFGIAGSLCVVLAALLGARKKVRTWRVGRAELWLRGHLWLGALALPLIWLHAGFRHGGTLTTTLMWLLYAIVVSGLLGAVLQHLLPRAMTRLVADETIYEQIPNVLEHLREEAADIVAVCGPDDADDLEAWRQQRTAALRLREGRALMTRERRDELLAALAAAPVAGSEPLRRLHRDLVEPFLAGAARRSPLGDDVRADAIFQQRRLTLPQPLHGALDDLRRVCDEARQLQLQRRLHHWLHGWLFVHVPLSMALLVLASVHAVVALRYIW